MPTFSIVGPMIESENISMENQKKYRSGVYMSLYLVENFRWVIANATKEISKANDGVTSAVFRELLCMITYELDEKNFGLKLQPTRNANKPWKIVCCSDSNYADDPVSKRSVSSFIPYVLDVLVSLQQKPKRV